MTDVPVLEYYLPEQLHLFMGYVFSQINTDTDRNSEKNP